MTRRGFLKAIGIASAAIAAAASLPRMLYDSEPIRIFDGPLMFKGHRIVFDRYCPNNTIYFINPNMRAWNIKTGERVA